MNTPEIEKLIYLYFEKSSLAIVPKISGNNWWLDTEADPMIWKNIVNHECDMLIVSKNQYLTEVEIKISLSDLRADFKKEHQHKDENIKNFYYAFPEEMKEKAIKLIPEKAGILIAVKKHLNSGYEYRDIECYRKPKINKEAKPINDIVLSRIYRLGYLRYWNYRTSKEVR
ncbi:DNA repair protein MmcB-related protein [uncultured Fusobacterium sp.]|uniref:DNA repair protein MmcB-related protein n=1 Tax=uncultured Fusobacterium sp. TaxID=159267 RepID=UPI0025EB3B44|nr:DNA repair protein MmcB-related protein [uncultured Fusobacterium sp.]